MGLLVALITTSPEARAQDSYRIQPGDVLRVEVVEDESLNRSLLVLPDGRVSMPLAGSVRAAGRTVEQVRGTLIAALTGNFARAPTVYVAVQQLAEPEPEPAPLPEPDPITYAIYILGEANTPGRIEVDPGTTVLQIFAQMGGFTNFAATKRIQLRRKETDGSEKIFRLNYEAIQEGRSRNGLTYVQDGDVFVIPQRRLFE